MAEQFTNIHALPPEVVAALTRDRYTADGEDPFDYSASTIVSPVQQTILKQRHKDNLKVFDVIDLFWSFLGSVSHSVLEEAWHESMGGFVEQRLYMDLCGKRISGKLDRYVKPAIRDYKSTKVYKIMKGDFEDWEKGQNVYAYLCRMNGLPVETLTIIALLFDWKKNEVYKKGYPKAPIVTIPLKLWTIQEQEDYVYDRLQLLKQAEQLDDFSLPECSEKERWQDPSKWAVIKKGCNRASRVFELSHEATEFMKTKSSDYEIVERPGTPKRCLEHCAAANHCHQYKRIVAERGGDMSGQSEPEELIF